MLDLKALPMAKAAFLPLLMAGLLGQAPATGPATKPAPEVHWGEAVDGCQIGVSIDKTKFNGTEGIIVHVRLRYTGPRQVEAPSGPLHLYTWEITREGKPCEKTAFGRDSDPSDPGAVFGSGHPGDSIGNGVEDVYDFPCSRVADMTQPGKYTIVIQRTLRYGPDRAKHNPESRPINVEVEDDPG